MLLRPHGKVASCGSPQPRNDSTSRCCLHTVGLQDVKAVLDGGARVFYTFTLSQPLLGCVVTEKKEKTSLLWT